MEPRNSCLWPVNSVPNYWSVGWGQLRVTNAGMKRERINRTRLNYEIGVVKKIKLKLPDIGVYQTLIVFNHDNMSKYSEYWSSSGKTNINYKATAPRYVKNEIKDMLWIRLCLQIQDFSFSLAFCQPDSDGVRVLEANKLYNHHAPHGSEPVTPSCPTVSLEQRGSLMSPNSSKNTLSFPN